MKLFCSLERTMRLWILSAFFRWQPATVTIGYFQKIKDEINIDHCRQQGYNVVRRPTGGKSVFHNQELTYSFITGIGNPLMDLDVVGSYQHISEGLLRGLNSLGIAAKRSGDPKKVTS